MRRGKRPRVVSRVSLDALSAQARGALASFPLNSTLQTLRIDYLSVAYVSTWSRKTRLIRYQRIQ